VRNWSQVAVSLCVIAWLTLAGAGPRVEAAERHPLPDVAVRTTDGASLTLSHLAQDGNWLLIYVTESSVASARLLDALERWQVDGTGRVAVLVGDPPASAGAYISKHRDRLPGVRWAIDADRSAWRALQLRGVPVLLGAVGPDVEWKLAGVLNDPSALEAVVRSWIDPKVR